MTIKVRIVGAFAIVLVVLLSLGANSVQTLKAIDREAVDVERGVGQTLVLAEFNGQIKLSFGLATQFTLSETAADLDSLEAALAKLRAAAAKVDERFFLKGSGDVELLDRETEAFFSQVDKVIALVKARQTTADEARDAIVNLQVLASAIADRAAANPDLSRSALKLVGGLGASGVSALRYRFSRDPADIDAAKKWSEISRTSLAALARTSDPDRQMLKFVTALAPAIEDYDHRLDGFHDATAEFARSAREWQETAERLQRDGVAARLSSSKRQQDAVERMRRSITWGRLFDICAVLLAFIISTLLAGVLVRSIAAPLVSITEAMRRLAAGELETPVPMSARRDEVGKMAAAVEVFRDGLLRVRSFDAQAEKEQRAKQDRMVKMEELNKTFETEVGAHTSSLSQAAVEMMDAAQALLEIAAQTSNRSGAVAMAAKEASSSVRLVAGSTEEVLASLKEISGEVSTSTITAGQTVRRAQEADVNVRALIAGAAKVGEVVGLIRAIAQETNLLALNATIEAARAGDAGRGFAVVAGEVKQLSIATSKATDEIGLQISNIQAAMQAAAATIEDIKSAIGGMDKNTFKIAGAVEEQSASIALITSSAARAAAGAEQVTTNIIDVMSASRSTDAAARQVLAAAEGVASRTRGMHEKVLTFLAQAKQV